MFQQHPLAIALLVVAACSSQTAAPKPPADAGTTDSAMADGGLSDAMAPDASTVDVAADATAAGMTVNQLCPALAKKQCAALASCGCPGAAAAVAACETKSQASCDKSIIAYIGGISMGTLLFDPAAAAECLVGFDKLASSCATPNNRVRPAACRALWIDAATVGKSCAPYALGLLCANKQGFCDPDKANTCATLPTDGQSCAKVMHCAAGLVCDAGVCHAPGAAGATCNADDGCQLPLVCGANKKCQTPGPSGSACQMTNQCAPGLRCVTGTCAAANPVGSACLGDQCGAGDYCVQTSYQFICRTKSKSGQGCVGPEGCEAGLYCDFEAGSVCKPLPTLGQKCPQFQCFAGLSCDVTATCVTAPGEGEPCLSGGSPACAPGLGCDPASGKCAKPAGVGSLCFDGLCAAGSYCDYVVNPPKCAAPQPEGGTCTGLDSACQGGLYCDGMSNKCAPLVALGGTCQMSNACGSGNFCKYATPAGPTGVCAPMPTKTGEACQDACGGGLFCGAPDGVCSKGICAMM